MPSFKRVCFRFPEMPQELNCEEENKLIILTNWVLMSLHSEQLALLQAWILNNAIMCASQECKFRSWLTPQWLHWSSYAVTSEHNLNCSRGPAKGLCHASGRWWWCKHMVTHLSFNFFLPQHRNRRGVVTHEHMAGYQLSAVQILHTHSTDTKSF